MHPKVSVIVPAYNEENHIKNCLDSILSLDYDPALIEVIVVDDGSTDSTASIISGYGNVQIIKGAHKGPSAGRNLAISKANGEFIALTDADCVVPRNWIKDLVAHFEDDNIAAVGGTQIPAQDSTDFEVSVQKVFSALGFVAGYGKKIAAPGSIDHNASCNVIYRKAVLMNVGGFDESLWPGEDVELDHKIKLKGLTLKQVPSVAVEHYRPRNIVQYRKMMNKYGAAQAYLVRKYGIFRLLQWVPILMPLVLVTLVVLLLKYASIFFWLYPAMLLCIAIFFGIIRKFHASVQKWALLFLTVMDWHIGFYSQIFRKKIKTL